MTFAKVSPAGGILSFADQPLRTRHSDVSAATRYKSGRKTRP